MYGTRNLETCASLVNLFIFGLVHIYLVEANQKSFVCIVAHGVKDQRNVSPRACTYLDMLKLPLLLSVLGMPTKVTTSQSCTVGFDFNMIYENCRDQNKNKALLRLSLMITFFCQFRRSNTLFSIKGYEKKTYNCISIFIKKCYYRQEA